VKKLFAIAFTCVYLTLAVGVVQTTHYCMGRVKSTSLYTFDSVKCPCYLFATDGKGKCCNDEHEVIKIEDDHAASAVVLLVAEFYEMGKVFQVKPTENLISNPGIFIEEASPPPNPIPLFAKYCSLIFYDSMMSLAYRQAG
jgi:hypothetical protein